MTVFWCLRSGKRRVVRISLCHVLPVETNVLNQFLMLRSKGAMKGEDGRSPHQVNACCSSGLGNVAFAGEFGDEINVPSSNCDGRWNPPRMLKLRLLKAGGDGKSVDWGNFGDVLYDDLHVCAANVRRNVAGRAEVENRQRG